MVAIETRFIGPTNTRGSRIAATDANGGRVVVPVDHALSSGQAHDVAALTLAHKRGWSGLWLRGETKKGSVYVCARPFHDEQPACVAYSIDGETLTLAALLRH